MNTTASLQAKLKKHGYSLTTPRRIVYEKFNDYTSYTMKNLITECSETVDKASVYRTTHLFESLGIIKRIQSGFKYKYELSDEFQPHHHHLHCFKCSTTITLSADDELEKRLFEVASRHDFTPQSHDIEIVGVCANCR